MAYQKPIEVAALNALTTWLRSKLPTPESGASGIAINNQWPDADKQLPARAISLIFAGDRLDTLTEPVVDSTEVIHAAVSPRIRTATATDLASAITLLNACRTSYEAHRISTAAHTTADTENDCVVPAATNQATAYALATELYGVITPHMGLLTAHPSADAANVINAAVTNTEAGLVAAAEAIRAALNKHYVARIYVWRIRSCEQPVQLDVWATYHGSREDIVARLEPLLNAAPSESAGVDDDDPVRNGVLVQLGDGWSGTADFLFEKPRRTDTTNSKKQNEYRATYAGVAEFWLLIKAQSPRMARLALTQTTEDAVGGVATTTSDADTFTS